MPVASSAAQDRPPPGWRQVPVVAFVFLGALLSFGLEPLAGRLLLPRFGGGFHVWTTALMFFQGALVLAYLYAHFLAARLGPFHLASIAVGLIALPPTLEGIGGDEGPLAILSLLLRGVGLPFTVLATTAVVAQGWWSRSVMVRNEPYVLYSVSNAGSLAALLLYAVVVERLMGLQAQRIAYTVGYAIYGVLAVAAYFSLRPSRLEVPLRARPEALAVPPIAPSTRVYWLLLSAAPSMFMMALTNLIALDAGSVPLVWVTPLAIYLGSFMIAFAKPGPDGESRVPRFVRRLWVHVAAVGLFFFSGGDAGGIVEVVVQLAVLAFVTLAAHAELHRVRPSARHLTEFYVVIAVGGWLGGIVVALVAPSFFSGLYEYPLALGLLIATFVVFTRSQLREAARTVPRLAIVATLALLLVIGIKVAVGSEGDDASTTLEVRRSFYGLYRVIETARAEGAVRDLVSGGTRHGRQRRGDATPLSYYHPHGPLGDVMEEVASPKRMGVIGLGVGAVAGYADPEDTLRFFEIDEVVAELATRRFTYLRDASIETDTVIGDARLSLVRERDAGAPPYDLLLVDAFSGDAIPTHLLTLEAITLDLERLESTGVLVFHVSNRYYDLHPWLAAAAARLGLFRVERAAIDGLAPDQDPSQYVAMARSSERLEGLRARGWTTPSHRTVDPWTDDRVDVMAAMFARIASY